MPLDSDLGSFEDPSGSSRPHGSATGSPPVLDSSIDLPGLTLGTYEGLPLTQRLLVWPLLTGDQQIRIGRQLSYSHYTELPESDQRTIWGHLDDVTRQTFAACGHHDFVDRPA